jgi:hypothetical protein
MDLSPLQNPPATQLPTFTEPEGPLMCSHEPSTGSYPDPDQSSPYHPILSLEDPF